MRDPAPHDAHQSTGGRSTRDIITGIFALPVAWLAKDVRPRHLNAIAAWDLFGAADLVLAITLGVTSAEGSPLQIFTAAPGSAPMQQLPWSFVPTVLVPFWLILHAIIWAPASSLAKTWQR